MSFPEAGRRVRLPHFHYAWVIAVVGGVVSLIGTEPLALFGIFLEPIAEGLGVSRGAVSSIYWVAYMVLGLASVAAGWAVDRIGIRKTLIFSTIATVIPLAMLSRSTHLWEVYLWYGVVYGIARGGFTAPTMVTVTLWFKKKQGLAVGIVSSGLAFGPMIFAPLFRYLISEFGWGNAFFWMGIGSGVILAPCCWLLRGRPSEMGLTAYGEGEEDTKKAIKVQSKKPVIEHQPLFFRKDTSNFFRFAMMTQPFLILPAIHLVGCVSHAVPLAHMVVMATDRGIDPMSAAMVLGVATGVSSVARLVAPMLSDKIGGRKVLMIFLAMQGISILWLLPAKDLWLFYVFSVFFGLGYGGEMTPFPVLNRQYYGTAPIGMLYGFQVMAACVGMGIGGFLGGYLYDLMGNYTLAIILAVGMGLAGAVLSYILVDPFKPGRKALAAAGMLSAK